MRRRIGQSSAVFALESRASLFYKSEVLPGDGELRFQGHRPPKIKNRLIELSLEVKGEAKIVARLGVVRPDFQRLAQVLDRRVRLAGVLQR